MIAGAAVGAAAIQGLHAQAKPKAFLVTESEILDHAALESYGSALASAMQAAGGHWIGGASGPTDKITAVIGDPPKRFGVTEFESIDKAQAWLKSSGAKRSPRNARRRSKLLGNSSSRGSSPTSFLMIRCRSGVIASVVMGNSCLE
jgi:uncharacterized protein (DUF1330 family)